MLDGELEVGCTPVFFIYLFVFVIFISESPMNRYVQTNCAPRIFFAPSAPNGEAHSLAYFRRTSLEGPHTFHSKIEYMSKSAVLLCDREYE